MLLLLIVSAKVSEEASPLLGIVVIAEEGCGLSLGLRLRIPEKTRRRLTGFRREQTCAKATGCGLIGILLLIVIVLTKGVAEQARALGLSRLRCAEH